MKAKLLSKQNRQLEKPLGSKLGSPRQAEGGEVIDPVPSDSTSAAWKWAERPSPQATMWLAARATAGRAIHVRGV
ncbi:hypothetical protein NQZ68_001287 [Dissostichus eleginoides]|nr:hypothetical protein NQZ68_001287 [Dissostichus eleginoides]